MNPDKFVDRLAACTFIAMAIAGVGMVVGAFVCPGLFVYVRVGLVVVGLSCCVLAGVELGWATDWRYVLRREAK